MSQVWLENSGFRALLPLQSGVDAAFAGLGYDSIRMLRGLADKRQKAGSILQTLSGEFSFEGAYGKSVFSHDHSTGKRETILVIRNGTPVPAA